MNLSFHITLTDKWRLWYKAPMRRMFACGFFLIWLGFGLFSQAIPEQGFFEDGASGVEVETLCLSLDQRGATVNCYITWLSESRQAVVVDPGTPAAAILKFIRAHRLKVLAILNTHGHWDHCGGDSFLAAKLSVPVYVHQADSKMASQNAGGKCPITFYPGTQRLILDGWEIDVIPTPGHSPGSVCLRIGETLFSGDILFAGAIGKADGDSQTKRRANLQLEIQNIRKFLLILTPTTRVFPGHGPATTISAEKAFNPYIIQ
jgi:hydroxyacylglutathione hydrolase